MEKILEKQGYHLGAAILLSSLVWIAVRILRLEGGWLGIPTGTWLTLAVAFPIVHQFYVAFCWRAELYHGWLSRVLGENAFSIYGAGFTLLFLARPATVLALGAADQGSLPVPIWINLPLILLCLGVSVYMAGSFVRYFNIEQALGMDHFDPEAYRDKPLVREGIFAWSSNAMYAYAFLALWMVGLAFQSRAALLAAAFNHLFIWAHFYFTEFPDIGEIYGGD
jgi:protein-S-isoprenylcysteine O-methyltransferase Ste14